MMRSIACSPARRGARARGASLALVASLTVVLAACTPPPRDVASRVPGSLTSAVPRRTGTPQLHVDVIAQGLSDVWDAGVLPDGQMLVTERSGRLSLLSSSQPGASVSPVAADFGDVFAKGDGGLMGLVVHPNFTQSRRFTTCETHADKGVPTDIRLVTWQLAKDGRSASRVADPLVGGLPVSTIGRNSGCRPTIATDGAMLVGTGDSARVGVPQNLTSLGGKVLRIDPANGGPPLGNPYAQVDNPAQRLILSYGHRNVLGIAVDPDTGRAYDAEQGAGTLDDEVNLLQPTGNYGWDPSQGGKLLAGYSDAFPMTDLKLYPDAIPAAWSSGPNAPGVSGAVFISGPDWGDLNGVLAVTTMKAKQLLLMKIGPDGKVTDVSAPAPLDGAYGALRSVRAGPDGSLIVTTGNGTDDKVLRVLPV